MSAEEFWEQLKSWLNLNAPDMLSLIRDPASKAEIASIESACGFPFPAELRASYLLHDGCDPDSGLIAGIGFMPLSSMRENWEMWSEIAADDDPGLNEFCSSSPDDAVQVKYANAAWLPFVGDSQHYVAIDFAPGPAGKYGQIINSGRDDDVRHVIAEDISGFFDFVTQQFNSGVVSVSSDSPGTAGHWLQIGGSHDLLTALPGLLANR